MELYSWDNLYALDHEDVATPLRKKRIEKDANTGRYTLHPVLVVEELYDKLWDHHHAGGHHAGGPLFHQVRSNAVYQFEASGRTVVVHGFEGAPIKLTAEFVKLCPTCNV